MQVIRIMVLAMLVCTMVLETPSAQQLFNSGSDGSYGPINVTTPTLTLTTPDNGIFNATTVTVPLGSTLTFTRNALNTPVYLLATGDITIVGTVHVNGSSGTTLVGGAGGPGGFDGGGPGLGRPLPGAGYGPGAGLGGTDSSGCSSGDPDSPGAAAYGTVSSAPSANDGKTYGSPLLVPLVGGSGGGGAPWSGGGGGGGAILLASNTKVHVAGFVQALGNMGLVSPVGWRCSAGSGGGIRIVAPVVSGTGNVNVTGGSAGSSDIGGQGRIRIDFIDGSQLTLTATPSGALSTGAFLAVFPPNFPRLDIINVAGQAIAVGTAGLVRVLLPIDVPSSQTVVVRASHFSGIVPIEVVLTPDSGDPVAYPASIDMSTGDPAQVAVTVDMPANVATRVSVWTRFQ